MRYHSIFRLLNMAWLVVLPLPAADALGGIVAKFHEQEGGLPVSFSEAGGHYGEGGRGWVDKWIYSNSTEGMTVTGRILNDRLSMTVSAKDSEGGVSVLFREYEGFENVSLDSPRTIRFDFRLDSDVGNFTDGHAISISEGRGYSPDGLKYKMHPGGSWWITVSGGVQPGEPVKGRSQKKLRWAFYRGGNSVNFDPNGFINTDIGLKTGVVYSFVITTDPETRKWKASISDGTTTAHTQNPDNPEDVWLDYRFQHFDTQKINPAGTLMFGVALPSGSEIQYSLGNVTIKED